MSSVTVKYAPIDRNDPDGKCRWYVWTMGRSGRRKTSLAQYLAQMRMAGRTEHADNILKKALEQGFEDRGIEESVERIVRKANDRALQKSETRCFYGSVALKHDTASVDFAKVLNDVIAHLAGQPGADVLLRLDIRVKAETAFDKNTRRTVIENAKTLGFSRADFGGGLDRTVAAKRELGNNILEREICRGED